MNKGEIADWFRGLQDRICSALGSLDGKEKFTEDSWVHHAGGGGRSRVIRDGSIFEKGGVNYSALEGSVPPVLQKETGSSDDKFFATGVSVVIHPESPLIPIIHMNVRYLETGNGQAWFGGGIDLTPVYIDKQDARFFHRELKRVCDKHHENYYADFRKQADEYFFIKHRNETRGIGGVFFDKLQDTGHFSLEMRWEFVKDVGELFIPLYTNIVKRHKGKPYDAGQKEWQLIRRGRYVEFNLVYDKGTRFGLETSGRTESILMSLPKEVKWYYGYHPAPGSPEAETVSFLRKDVNWI